MVVRAGSGMRWVAGILLASGCALVASAQQATGQSGAVSDAQIEANVLKALATAPELSTQNIQTTTVYGVVTLSGSANDEASRTKAENLVSRVAGVKKVVDEMTLGGGDSAAPAQADAAQAPQGLVLQSDGTYAPGNTPEQVTQIPQTQGPPPARGTAGPPPDMQADGQYGPPQQGQYPQQDPYADPGRYPQRRPMYRGQRNGYPAQVAGRPVTVAPGAMVQIRINQGLSSHHAQPGMVFDGTVLNDVVADGAIAIPRGAQVQGVVADAKKAGALKGKGELALQITRLTLGGQVYTLASDTWYREGSDKTGRTVGSAIALGAVGALFGGAVGGGGGAAAGAAIGGAAGVASSAASPGGNLIVPPEAVLTFHLSQPVTVATVSQQEMARLAYAAGPNVGAQPVMRRRAAYPPPVYYSPYPPPGPYYYPRY